jgi:class 3 adenylate cyclase
LKCFENPLGLFLKSGKIKLTKAVNMGKSIEDRAREILHTFLSKWTSRDENALDEIMSITGNDFSGFGTEIDEIWENREEFQMKISNEFEKFPDPLETKVKWLETRAFGNTVLCFGDCEVKAKLATGIIEIDPLRFTAIFTETDQGLKWVHWNSSRPDPGITAGAILPISEEPKKFDQVSILFSDLVGFTKLVSKMPAQELVSELNKLFNGFDAIVKDHGVEKIKTIGDAYMAVAGLDDESDHAIRSVKAAQNMLEFLDDRNRNSNRKWELRIGIHSGPVIGGIIDNKSLRFDLWGDTVNLASRLEGHGTPGMVNISATTYEMVKDHFTCKYRGTFEVKGKGDVEMYFVM